MAEFEKVDGKQYNLNAGEAGVELYGRTTGNVNVALQVTADGKLVIDSDSLTAGLDDVYVRRDGTLELTADWNAGSFEISAKTFLAENGTAGAPAFGFQDESGLGFFRSNNNEISFASASAIKVIVASNLFTINTDVLLITDNELQFRSGGQNIKSEDSTFLTITSSQTKISDILKLGDRLQVTGNGAPTADTGVELAYNSATGEGAVLAYDRDSAVYKNLLLVGLTLDFKINNSTEVLIDANQMTFNSGSSDPSFQWDTDGELTAFIDSTEVWNFTDSLFNILKSTRIDNGRLQVTGSTVPSSGAGVEFSYDGSASSTIVSYDRDASAYKKLRFNANEHEFRINGSIEMTLSANQILFNNGVTDTKIDWSNTGQIDFYQGSTREFIISSLGVEAPNGRVKASDALAVSGDGGIGKGELRFVNSVTATSAGSAPTLDRIGGGPSGTAQTHWLKFYDGTTARYMAVWT